MTATVTLPRDRLIELFTLRIRGAVVTIKGAMHDETAFRAYFDARAVSSLAENVVDTSDDPEFKAAMTDAMIEITVKLEQALKDRQSWESRTTAAEHWIKRKSEQQAARSSGAPARADIARLFYAIRDQYQERQ